MLDVREARQVFVAAGYDPAYIRPDYSFTCRDPDGRLVNRAVVLAAFGATPFNLRSACLTFDRAASVQEMDERFKYLRFLAAPLALINVGNHTELWSIRTDEAPVRIKEGAPADGLSAFVPLLREFSPNAVLSAKVGQRQMGFVDSGLAEWAERITEQTLVYLLETLLAAAAKQMHKSQSLRPESRLALMRLVFHLFASRVLEDKGVIPVSTGALESLTAAHNLFSENIDPGVLDSASLTAAVIRYVYSELRGQFAFASLTTEMLGYAYENALVTAHLRRQQGIYYTPRIVTNDILGRLPIESIDREDRFVLDPCCGSGSFLLAGFDRLNRLLPPEWSPAKRHQYLRTRLAGSDIDDFAIEVASLSLVVTDPENRNGWQVQHRDVLETNRADFRTRPTIILTNPPFKEVKKHGTRRELAGDILIRVVQLLAPGGLVGVVLPQSILDSRAGMQCRRELLQSCDIIEIDTLPGGLFQSAAETAVIMARKREPRTASVKAPRAPVTVRELRAKDLPKFKSLNTYTATYSVDPLDWVNDPEARFIVSPFVDLWHRLESRHGRLADVAAVRSGIQVKSNDVDSVSAQRRPGDVPFIDRPDVLRPFALLTAVLQTKWLRYGPQLRRACDESIFKGKKIVINSNRKPGSVWRLIAAPAPTGLYFSENFHAVIPVPGAASTEEVLAVLNSPVANAWFDAHCKKRKVVQRTLEELPFPKFDDGAARLVQSLARQLEKAIVEKWKSSLDGLFYDELIETFDSAKLLHDIDTVVYEAYGLLPVEVKMIERYMGNEKRPG